MKELSNIIITLALYLPCLAAFSEGDDIRVNIFGIAYTAVLISAYKYIPEVVNKVKSIFTL